MTDTPAQGREDDKPPEFLDEIPEGAVAAINTMVYRGFKYRADLDHQPVRWVRKEPFPC